jgi:hypothetical protein
MMAPHQKVPEEEYNTIGGCRSARSRNIDDAVKRRAIFQSVSASQAHKTDELDSNLSKRNNHGYLE